MLQAEEDRDLVRRQWADKARERELMGAEMKVYNSDRYVIVYFGGIFGYRRRCYHYWEAPSEMAVRRVSFKLAMIKHLSDLRCVR